MASLQPIALVTGAEGFIGRFVSAGLASAGWRVRRAIRSIPSGPLDADTFVGRELSLSTEWQDALADVQVVVHTAARAHLPAHVQASERDLYMSVNVDGTLHLARCAANAGVRDFVFLSSIAVNGSTTDHRSPFTEIDILSPVNVYGQSKAAAEVGLAELSASMAIRVTAIRPPMIYGSGARGNFRRLAMAVKAGVPLPFGLIRNRRAFLGVDNLVSFILHRLNTAGGSHFETFLVADDPPLSTPAFVRELGRVLERPARLFPFPVPLLRAALSPLSLGDALISSLELDTSRARATGWHPEIDLAEGLVRAIKGLAPKRGVLDDNTMPPR
jgi:UDP-glucose 4-epimerase